MDSQASPFPNQPIADASATGTPYRPTTRLQRALVFAVKFWWGMLFCQGLLGSILVVGWSYRLAQRTALRFWFLRSPRPQGRVGFGGVLGGQEFSRQAAGVRNWCLAQGFPQTEVPQLKPGLGT